MSSGRQSEGSTFDLHEALKKLEPDVISATRDEAISRSRAGSEKKKFSIALPRFSRSPSPTPSSNGKKKKRGKSPLTVDAIGAPMDLRQMGAPSSPTGPPGQSPTFLSPSSAMSPSSSGTASPNSYASASPSQPSPSGATPSPTTPSPIDANAATLRLRKPSPEPTSPISTTPKPVDPTTPTKSEPREYRVVKEFKANEDTELSLEVGDLIDLLEQPASDTEFWWFGISRTWGPNNGLKGFFPAECVVLETFQEPEPVPVPVIVKIDTAVVSIAAVHEDEWIEEEMAAELPATVKPGIKLVCIYPFERSKADELELEIGDIVVVLESPEGGWWRGMKGFSTKTPTSGWFPNSLVTLAPGENIPGWSPTVKVRTKKEPVVGMPVLDETPTTVIPPILHSVPSKADTPPQIEPLPSTGPQDTQDSSNESKESPLSANTEVSKSIFLLSEIISIKEGKSETSLSDFTTKQAEVVAQTITTSRKSSIVPPGSEPPSHNTSHRRDSDVVRSSTKSLNEGIELEVPSLPIGESIRPPAANLPQEQGSEASPSIAATDEQNLPETVSEKAASEFLTPDEASSEASDGEQLSTFSKMNEAASTVHIEDDKKLMIPKKNRHLRALSMPATMNPGHQKSTGSLGPLVDEPEDENDMEPKLPLVSPATNGNSTLGGARMSEAIPPHANTGDRWSTFKQTHMRSMSQADTNSIASRASTVAKWALPVVEGSRSSLAIRLNDGHETGQWSEGLTPEQVEAMDEKEKKRMKVVYELIETERDYVRDLKIIIEHFMRPMAESKFSKNVDSLFSNVDELLGINSDFLKTFETKVKNSPNFHGVGEIFLELGDSFAKYSLYCANNSVALKNLQNLLQNNRAFRLFLEDICKNPVTRQLDLGGFLIKPVQRICKYPLLLKEIIKNTDENHREYPILKLALETIQAIISQVNDGARAAEGVRKMVEVQSSFTEKLNLITPTRYLVREDSLNLIRGDSKKARKLFLFNDLVILARKDWQSKLRLMDQFNLRHCRICDIIDDNDQPGSMFEIEVIPAGGSSATSKVRRFLFSAETIKIKTQWIESYRSVASVSVKKKKFSDTVIDGEDDENVSSGNTIPNGVEEDGEDDVPQKEKDIPIHKKVEMYKEEAKKALIEEYKARIGELEKMLSIADQSNQDLTLKLTASETKVTELETVKSDLDSQLWTVNCALSESHALVETLKTNVKETVQAKEADMSNITNALQATIAKTEALKAEVFTVRADAALQLEQKNIEIQKIKTELVQTLEIEKTKLTAQLKKKEEVVHSLEVKMEIAKTEFAAKLVEAKQEAEKIAKETKQTAEIKITELTQTYEAKIADIEEDSASKVHELKTILQHDRETSKVEIETLQEKYRVFEQQSQSEKQRLSADLETLKRKAYQAHESLKKALSETKTQLEASNKTVKEKESNIHERDETIREKSNTISRLDLEKQSLTAELNRTNANAENSRQEYTKLLSNLERVVQERHQVLTRKESEISELSQRVAQYSERAKNSEHSAEQARTILSDKQMHFEETLSLLREEASKTRAERAREMEQLENLSSTHKDTCKQLESTRSQLNNASDANRRLASENAKMKDLIATQTKEISTTSQEFQQLKLSFSELQDRFKRKEYDLLQLENSETSLKEQIKTMEEQCHQLVIGCERSDTRNYEMSKTIEQNEREIFELKESVRKITEFAQAQLHQELTELKEKMCAEASLRYEYLAKENAELHVRLNREMAELKTKKEHEEQIMAGQLELVERLEKETTSSKIRCEKEIEGLKAANLHLDEEVKEKTKCLGTLKKKLKQAETERDSFEKRGQELSLANQKLQDQNQKLSAYTKSQEDDLLFMKNRLTNAEKEANALTNRLDLYSELDRKYNQLRGHSDQVSFEVKSKEEQIRRTEEQRDRKDKEIAALEFILDEISNVAYNVNISPVQHVWGLSPIHNIRISGLKDDSKAKSILSRINDISIDYDRLHNEFLATMTKATVLEKEKAELLKERDLTLTNLRKIETKFKEKTQMYKQDVELMEEELSTSKEEFEAMRHAKLECDAKLNMSIVELTEVENKLTKLEKEHNTLIETHQKLKVAQSNLSDESKKEINALRFSVADLRKTHKETILKVKELEGENAYLKSLTDNLMGMKMKLQASLDFVNSTSSTLVSELEQLKLELSDKSLQCIALNDSNNKHITKVNTLEELLKSEREKHNIFAKEYTQKLESVESEVWRREADLHHRFQTSVDKKQMEIEDRDHKIHQLTDSLNDSHQRIDRLSLEITDLEEKIAKMKSENQVLCTEVVEISRRENAMRCKLDIIQSKIVASNQNIEDIKISEQALSNAFGMEYQEWKPRTGDLYLHEPAVCSQPHQLSPHPKSTGEESLAATNKRLIKSTLKMIDGILGKKTLILRKLVSCEKSILSLLDAQISEKLDFDGILEMSSIVQSRCSFNGSAPPISKDTALQTLEYLANVSSSINHSREGKLVIIHRARRDVTVAKDFLHEMHEFVRIWLGGFDEISAAGHVPLLASNHKSQIKKEGNVLDDSMIVGNDNTMVAEAVEPNPAATKTPAILLALPRLGNLFEEGEINSLL
ncbi:UNVERIFIED_CONTAM: cytochrome c oxidase subunit 1, partial [Siphonaria sp. JEL0065]